jgi:hypothetical protein
MKRQLLLEGGGFTGIYAPDGQLMHSRCPRAGGLVYADIDLGMIALAKAAADPAGLAALLGMRQRRHALRVGQLRLAPRPPAGARSRCARRHRRPG